MKVHIEFKVIGPPHRQVNFEIRSYLFADFQVVGEPHKWSVFDNSHEAIVAAGRLANDAAVDGYISTSVSVEVGEVDEVVGG